jgi:hypothetical protein
MLIQDRLLEILQSFVTSNGKAPKVIIMSESKYKKFIDELTGTTNIDYSKTINPKYHGIKIIRSNDVSLIEVF